MTAASTARVPDLGPVSTQDRIETIDILRGFALLCILIVNWTTDTLWDLSPSGSWLDTADRYAYWAADTLLNEKSWPMFAMLFGIGFAIQMERAARRGRPFLRTYARRLALLAAIGVVHNMLTERDILFNWALAGFALIPVRKLPLNLLLALALACELFNGARHALNRRETALRWDNAHTAVNVDPATLRAYVGAYEINRNRPALLITMRDDVLHGEFYRGYSFRLFPASSIDFFGRAWRGELSFVKDSTGAVTAVALHRLQGEDIIATKSLTEPYVADYVAIRRQLLSRPADHTYATGTIGQVVSMRAPEVWAKVSDWHYYTAFLLGTWVFPPFLLGLYAGRRRIFHDVGAHRLLIRRVFWWSAAFAVAYQVYHYLSGPDGLFAADAWPFALRAPGIIAKDTCELALAVAYITGLALLVERAVWKRRLGWLAPVGRMALTNYLLQSVAFVALFFGYGLGLYGRVGAFGGALLAALLFAVQVVTSRWWLWRFRFGPVEWLWRSLTYGERQPLRVGRHDTTARAEAS